MDLTSPQNIKELLSKYGTRPSKGLGQNFLIDKNVLDKIINSADIKPNDIVLEVGPGIGTLTQELAQRAKKVIAVEKDKKMVNILTDVLNDSSVQNVQIVNADILRYKLQTTHYKLIANIPYYLTSPLIRKFLEIDNPPSEMILMLQKEVAQRICSKPPSPPTNFEREKLKDAGRALNPKLVGGKMNLLAVSVQFYAEAKIISYVSKNCFWPSPKVDSAIIKITPIDSRRDRRDPFPIQLDRERVSNQLFFKVVKAGFSQPRKQLAGNLSKILKIDKGKTAAWLIKNEIRPTQRAETLSVGEWIKLVSSL